MYNPPVILKKQTGGQQSRPGNQDILSRQVCPSSTVLLSVRKHLLTSHLSLFFSHFHKLSEHSTAQHSTDILVSSGLGQLNLTHKKAATGGVSQLFQRRSALFSSSAPTSNITQNLLICIKTCSHALKEQNPAKELRGTAGSLVW